MTARPPAPGPDSSWAEDLRLPLVGLAAWLGGLGAICWPWWTVSSAGVAGLVGVLLLRAGRRSWRLPAALVLAAAAVAGVVLARTAATSGGPVAELGRRHAAVSVELRVATDPRRVTGRYSDSTVLQARLLEVRTSDRAWTVGAPVLVLAGDDWAGLRLGSTVRASGRLEPTTEPGLAAELVVRGAARPVAGPAWWWRAADGVRAALARSVSGLPPSQRALVPALVVGDDSRVEEVVAADFRTTGLTHLLAVSGTNLTLLLGFVMILARWAGVRGRWSYLVAASGIVGFVLLARPEPSVLRAAVMGTVGLVALGPSGRRRGGRSLGVAVTVLLLLDPWLAIRPGFALSVLATGGIVFAAPRWRDALARWLPRWAAEAIAVPAAAQLACTPVVAGLSGSVSLVAVAANLLAAPVVGPATVLGLGAALTSLAWPAVGRLLGRLAGWCVGWLVTVAEHGAALPRPAVEWGTGPAALAVLSVLCLAALVGAPRLLRRRATGALCCAGLVAALLVRLPGWGWPPPGWLLVACDVGQGDALVLNAGGGSAVVVDAGPDPALVDHCLDELGVRSVPLLVLTHFHADHVGGVAGVLRGRTVGVVEVTSLRDPPQGVALVEQVVGEGRVASGSPVVAPYRTPVRVGAVRLEALWPLPGSPTRGPGDGSTANGASVVLLVEVRGVRILLPGDLEPEGQAALAALVPELRADVLKVPHHGSRYQDPDWLLGLGAEVAVVSVGADNDYGHPAAATLDLMREAGAEVYRTDRDGTVAVCLADGRLTVLRHG